jgi:hypothetical protein
MSRLKCAFYKKMNGNMCYQEDVLRCNCVYASICKSNLEKKCVQKKSFNAIYSRREWHNDFSARMTLRDLKFREA